METEYIWKINGSRRVPEYSLSNLTCTVHGFIFMLFVPCSMWLNRHSAVVYDLLADVPRMVHYKTSDGLIDCSGSWSGFVSLLVVLHIF